MDSATRHALVLTAMLLASPSVAQQASTVIGVPEDLARGADALRGGDYDTGVQLTLLGLDQEATPRNRAAGLSNLCAGYHALRRFADALDACTRSLQINRYNWRAWHNLALTHIGLDQLEHARAELQRALALLPESTQLVKMLELVDAELGPQPSITFEEPR